MQADPPTLTVYDRLIPCELYGREDFLDLPSDTARLLFLALMGRVDDFGNVELDVRRLFRWAWTFTQIKSPQALAAAISALQRAGLVRGYEVAGRHFLHILRFRNSRTYTSRQCPGSPWDLNLPIGPFKAGARRGDRTALVVARQSEENTSQINGAATKSESGLRVQVGVGEERKSDPQPPVRASLPVGWTVPDEWIQWAVRFREDQARPLAVAEIRALADRFGDLRRSKEGVDGGNIDWLRRWRNWVCVARAGDST